jgi:hypothetical protein
MFLLLDFSGGFIFREHAYVGFPMFRQTLQLTSSGLMT